jgi:hypothetical protein
MAAQINGQLEFGAPAALSFEAITISALRESWLNHHDQVRRSSLATINPDYSPRNTWRGLSPAAHEE